MNRESAEKLVSKTFNFPFNGDKYAELVSNIFKKSVNVEETFFEVSDKFKDYIKNLRVFSNLKDQDGKKIDAIEVKLDDQVSFDKSRYIQRNIATHYLKKNNCNAVLISFHNLKSEDWRFSLITRETKAHLDKKGNIKVEIQTSPLKRLSYLIGKNEPNFTAKSQILTLLINEKNNLNQIQNAFNLEQVTEDFFEDYKKLYIELTKEIERLIKTDNKIKNDFKSKNINADNFSKKLLGQIVFLYFLQKKGWLGIDRNENDNFKKWGSGSKTFLQDLFKKYKSKNIKANNFFNNILEPIFYDALNNEEEYYDKLDCKIPFLNGGLFKPFNEYNWTETDIEIKDSLIEKIFNTFNQYNFTVQEDQDFDADVAVDPEMLGKVFENLLPENFKKGKGSYYTPRVVVNYMCKQSIKNYLINNSDKKIDKNTIEKIINLSLSDNEENIIDLKETSKNEDLKLINELLNKIKVCDPAIGSGAFPVQMMNEIVNIRMIISDILNLNYSNYTIKRNFIENSIYGVDIDSSAIEIAKLRLWLSLIVDEKSFEKIQPLPNLDYKILQGNSLIQKYKNFDFENKEKNELFEDEELTILKKELVEIQHEYFNSSSRKKSKKLQELLNIKIGSLISKKTNIKKINENFISLIEERNFFFWKILFIDVFEKGGFDLVIGNPPYVFARSSQLKGFTKEDKNYYVKNYELTKYQLNTYSLFVELGTKILNQKGILSYIIPNNWMTINSNIDLRKYVLEKDNVQIVIFSDKVFKYAEVDVAILIFNNIENLENTISIYQEKDKNIFLRARNNANILRDEEFEFIINFNVLSDPKLKDIVKKINQKSHRLSPYFSKVKSGLIAYEKGKGSPPQTKEILNNRSYHSNKKKNSDYLKYLEGDDVKRYSSTWSKTYLKYGRNLAAPRSLNLFTTKRILVRQIPSKPPYCINAHYFSEKYLNDRNSMNVIDFNLDPLVILGMINSKMVSFWFIVRFAKLQRSLFPQFKVNELEKFPILKSINKKDAIKISNLVKKKIHTPSNEKLDEELDNFVYKIFDISKEDQKYINSYLDSFTN